MAPSPWKIRYLRLVRKVHRLVRSSKLRKYNWWRPITRALTDRRHWVPSRETVANGLSIGLFFAMMPIPGQTIVSTIFAVRAKANIPFAVAACFLTNPFTEPFFRALQLRFGHWLRGELGIPMPSFGEVTLKIAGKLVPLNVSSFILGFLAMGILCALLVYPIIYLISAIIPQYLPKLQDVTEKRRRKRPPNENQAP